MRHGIISAALLLTVLSTGQALADDSLAPGTDDETVQATDGYSLWDNLRELFSDSTVSFGATPLATDRTPAGDSGYNAFAQIDVDGFTIGGRFARWGETDFTGADRESFGLGASYRLDAWTVGIDWSRGNFDEVFLDVDSGDNSDVVAFTSSYALRPGVKINGLLEYSDAKPAADSPAPGAFTVGIGTLINF